MDNNYKPLVDIIMPTYQNNQYLNQAVISLYRNTPTPYRLFVVCNDGENKVFALSHNKQPHFIHSIRMERNEGWMGGINRGIETIQKEHGGLSEYVLFCNDDVRFLDHHNDWLMNMINIMRRYPKVGAVGPCSNKVLYYQSLNFTAPVHHTIPVISGFCMLTRKSVIEELGGLDETLFGGDDIDFSIRLRDAGYELVCCRRSFVYHHYAQTGKRLHADWDGPEWADKINKSLIQKHGFNKWNDIQNKPHQCQWLDNLEDYKIEKNMIRNFIGEVNGHRIIDLGCGGDKIHPNAVGVDTVGNGGHSNSGRALENEGVDVIADISEELPFEDGEADVVVGKHVLEHITDHLKALKEWKRILRPGGRLFIAVPEPDFIDAINCDPTHVHAFTQESLKTALELVGFKVKQQRSIEGGWTFITEAIKEGE